MTEEGEASLDLVVEGGERLERELLRDNCVTCFGIGTLWGVTGGNGKRGVDGGSGASRGNDSVLESMRRATPADGFFGLGELDIEGRDLEDPA